MTTAHAATFQKPSKLLALTELPRAAFEFGSLAWSAPLLLAAPQGDGHPVLVLPGFIGSDLSTGVLRRFLDAKGYDAQSWNLGTNLGPRAIGRAGEKLVARLEAIHAATGRKVSVVGWSLGGLMARRLANQHPALIRQVITLGSPFGGSLKESNIWRAYEAITGEAVERGSTKQMHDRSKPAPAVPTTAIFTKSDGVVAWQNCRATARQATDNIEVYGSHVGLAVNPSVLHAIADRLAQPEGAFKRFERTGLGRLVYPSSGH